MDPPNQCSKARDRDALADGCAQVLIVGTSGSGKTTLGRELARLLGVRFIETDALCHGPNWTEVSDDVLRLRLQTAMRAPGWVVDNGYARKVGDLVLHRADTIVWIDLPLVVSQWRLVRRSLRNLYRHEELWNGNRQTLRRAFWGRDCLAAWAIRTHYRLRRTVPVRVGHAPNNPRLVRLRSSRAVHRWLGAQAKRALAGESTCDPINDTAPRSGAAGAQSRSSGRPAR